MKHLIISLICIMAYHIAYSDDVCLETVIQIESSGNPEAYNSKSQARGLMQVTPISLEDYNNFHSINFEVDALYCPEVNVMVGNWYLNVRIPRMLEYYCIEDTAENRLIAYNWGIKNLIKHLKNGVRLPRETRMYLVKYKRLTKGE